MNETFGILKESKSRLHGILKMQFFKVAFFKYVDLSNIVICSKNHTFVAGSLEQISHCLFQNIGFLFVMVSNIKK